MVTRDLQYGDRVIRRVMDKLQRPAEIEHQYAEAVLTQAVRTAAGRPTPQSVMAARNLVVSGSTIRSSAGGAPAAVAGGSEFGSSIYRQFHAPHNPRGYWLLPSAEHSSVLRAGDKVLEDVLQKAIRGI